MKTLPLLLLLLAACSRDTAQRAHGRPQEQPSPSALLVSQDRDFLERASEGNNAEAAIGNLVHGNALRAEVVSLGTMIAADHVAAQRELTAIATAKHISLTTSLG